MIPGGLEKGGEMIVLTLTSGVAGESRREREMRGELSKFHSCFCDKIKTIN